MADAAIIVLVVFIVFIVLAIIVIVVVVALAQEGVGKSCTTNAQCGSDFLCVSSGSGKECRKKDGQFCLDKSECASNSCVNEFCAPTIIPLTSCTGTVGTQGSCGTGDLCASDGKCLSGLFHTCKLARDCFYKPSVCTGPTGGAAPVCLSGPGGFCMGGSGCESGFKCCTPSGSTTGMCMVTCPNAAPEFMSPAPAMAMGLSALPRMMALQGTQMGMRYDDLSTHRTPTTFCVESGLPTRTERVDDFGTPPYGEVAAPLKKIRKDMAISRENTKQSPVIDVTSYSNATLALMKDGKIIRESRDKKREIVANNIRLKRLESFNGTLYGISVDGRVFQLNNDTFETRKWLWTLAPLPTGIIHTSATLNGKHFWVQTQESGLLYDRQFRVVDRAPTKNIKRVYGNDKNIYIDIDTQNNVGTLQPNGSQVKDVAGAIITHDNQLKILRPNQTNLFSDIRLLDWTPTYLLKTL